MKKVLVFPVRRLFRSWRVRNSYAPKGMIMKTNSSFAPARHLLLLGSVCLAVSSGFAPSAFGLATAAAEQKLVEQLSGQSILASTVPLLEGAVGAASQKQPGSAPDYVRVTLKSRPDADAIAPAIVAAAVKGVGPDAAPTLIGRIVYEAVRVTPDAVLDIVRAAVRNSPASYAPEIVSAAVGAVPDPYKLVVCECDAYASDGKTMLDKKTILADGGSGRPARAGDLMPLVEAISAAAMCERPELDLLTLVSSAQTALLYGVPPIYVSNYPKEPRRLIPPTKETPPDEPPDRDPVSK